MGHSLQTGVGLAKTYDSAHDPLVECQGLNKGAPHREIGSHPKKLGCVCVALLETRVKKENAARIQNNKRKIIMVNIMAEYGYCGIIEKLNTEN